MRKSIGELGIGTFDDIATVSYYIILYVKKLFTRIVYFPQVCLYDSLQACETTPIILALNTFHERRVSALPIINAAGVAVR